MQQNSENIFFHNLYGYFYFPKRKVVKEFIHELLEKEGKTAESINYIFCTDDYLIQMNKEYLNHDTYTDIITFELNEKNKPLVSDIYISIDRVKENARQFNISFTQEFLRVVFHGALHLCGYKDKTLKDAKQMREKEAFYLDYFYVSRNTVSKRNN
jgi:rRNA maturation RNase YbeY